MIRVINMPHTKKSLSRDFVGNKDQSAKSSMSCQPVEKRGESISDYLAPDVFLAMDVPVVENQRRFGCLTQTLL